MLVELVASDNALDCMPSALVKITENIHLYEQNLAVSGILIEDKLCFYAYLKTLNSWDNLVVYQQKEINKNMLLVQPDFLEQRKLEEGDFARLEPVANVVII